MTEADIPDFHFRVRFKRRRVVFTLKDEALFTEALKLEIPRVRFFEWVRSGDGREQRRELSSLVEGNTGQISLVFPECMGPIEIEERFSQDQSWQREGREPEHRSMSYLRGHWEWSDAHYRDRLSYDPPTLYEGDINARYYPDDPGHTMQLAIVKRVWKAIGRVAVGKFKEGHPIEIELMRGSDVVLMKDVKHRNPWMGHWALQWCRDGAAAGKRRMLCGSYRPCDDWEMPKNPEYQALCRIVEEKYGKDFGGPPGDPQ